MYVNALTNVGLVRKDNEDNYLVSVERGLFAVADGMGGHLGGQVASNIAIKTLDQEIRELQGKDTAVILKEALFKANENILVRGQDEELHGMGTTVTAAILIGNLLNIAHIGDSRAYLWRKNKLSLLTQDHSLVNELLQNGSLTMEEAHNHPQRNILTRALGIHKEPRIDLISMPVQNGDNLLLCTDGLYNHVADSELELLLKMELPMKEKVQQMVDAALKQGGTDNITVVLVQYE